MKDGIYPFNEYITISGSETVSAVSIVFKK